MSGTLAIKTFRTSEFDPARRFDAWRDCMAPMFDVDSPATPQDFFAEYDAWLVGPLVLGKTRFDAHNYGRDAKRAGRDGVNHYHLNLHVSGGNQALVGTRALTTVAGDITLYDFSQPVVARSRASELVVVAVPRDLLEIRLPPGDHHGLVLRESEGLGALLGDYLRSLAARLPALTQDEAAAVSGATVELIAACFHPSVPHLDAAGATLNHLLFDRARRYIDQHLGDETIRAEDICRAVGVSRAALYRMFRSRGGVARYIWDQRLSRAFTTLMTPAERRRRISEIAFSSGFKSEAHFSRAFKAAFGSTPRDVQAMSLTELTEFGIRRPAAAAEFEQVALSTRELLAAIRRL